MTPRAAFFRNIGPESFPFGLGSDNHSGVHPRILKTLELVNDGFAPSYGTDIVTEEARRIFKSHFGAETDVHFCFNGTAANVLALSVLVKSHHTIICTDSAHIHVDECAAPEKHLGSKLLIATSPDAKLTPELIEPFLIRRGDQHFAQARAISITQPTELGTVYSKDEIRNLVEFCKKNDLWIHVDGARFINAVIRNESEMKDLIQGVDSLSFGGTKNGLMFGEAVLFLSERAREAAQDFLYVRKQLMQLPSKTRFVAAQFVELLGTDLWLEIAKNSLDRAAELRAGLEKLCVSVSTAQEKIQFTQKTDSNVVFVRLDRQLEKALKKFAFFYIWNEATRECRLMTSWNTTSQQIQDFLKTAESTLKALAEGDSK